MMFEIKENNLENLFEIFSSALWEEKVKLLSDLSKNISNENSMAVLAFLIEITSELKIKVPSFAFETLEDHLNQIKRLLKDFLPSDCLFLLEKISEFDFQELVEERKVINAYDYLTKIITDSLITFSTKEIEQLVNIYFDKNNFVLQTDIFEYFLKKIDQSKFIGNKEREFIFKSIQNKEIENLLTFLEKSKSKDEIIYSIYFYNPKFYDNLVKFIINLQITNLYDCLPQINEKLLFSKEVDSNILLKILLERPILFDKTINFIINEVFEENKENLIKLISENYELLGKKIHLFPFSFSDILKISENNFDLFKNLMDNLEKYENINCTELNSYFVKLTNDKKIEVFTIILKQESEIKKEIIKNFIENVSLPQELIEFFLKNLNDSYFYCMLPYYKKEKQLESLSKHLKDKESLNYFLKVFSLGELFYFSHYIKDISQAKNAIQLCIDHPQFSENVILFAIPKMEYENLPCLFMRSIILSYLKFKDKKLFVLILNKIIKKKFWNDQALVEGFVKMLELLFFDSIDVLKNIEHDILINFLKRNKSILNLCKEYFNKNEPSDYPSEHLRKTVHSIK